MLVRKVPGFVPASSWGLRLPQKFLFLLFLSGLVTLCFGALFLLPHSSRLKRLFSASRTQQPGLEVMAEIAGHHSVSEQEPPPNPAPAAPAPGEDDPGRLVGVLRRKGWLRRTRPTGPREEGNRPQEESVRFSFDYNSFRSRLRHPVLGTRTDESQESQSLVRAQREKIKEMMRFSWQSYRRYAMGKNELRPLTKDGFEGSMFGELTQTPGRRAQQRHFGPSFSGLSQAFSGLRGPKCVRPLLPPHLRAVELGKVRMVRGGEHGRLGRYTLWMVVARRLCLQREPTGV